MAVGHAGVRADGRCPWRPTEWCPWRPNETDTRILRLIAEGKSDRDIGKRLSLSTGTVSHYVGRLARMVGVEVTPRGSESVTSVRVQLAVWAAEHGLLQTNTHAQGEN